MRAQTSMQLAQGGDGMRSIYEVMFSYLNAVRRPVRDPMLSKRHHQNPINIAKLIYIYSIGGCIIARIGGRQPKFVTELMKAALLVRKPENSNNMWLLIGITDDQIQSNEIHRALVAACTLSANRKIDWTLDGTLELVFRWAAADEQVCTHRNCAISIPNF